MGKPEQEIVLMFRKAGKLNDAVGEAARHGANTAVSNKTGMTLEELAKSRGLSLDILRKLATD